MSVEIARLIDKHFSTVSWILGAVAIALPILAWLERSGSREALTLYALFPLLGLVAFSLMWTHFIIGSLRRILGRTKLANDSYGHASMAIVLVLIILHPGLLWFALYRDGFGLPPMSSAIVYENQLVFLVLGSIALTIFLAYELGRWFRYKSWWKYVEHAQVPAMLFIFVHALELGSELKVDWFLVIWWLLGLSLTASVTYNWWYDKKQAI